MSLFTVYKRNGKIRDGEAKDTERWVGEGKNKKGRKGERRERRKK